MKHEETINKFIVFVESLNPETSEISWKGIYREFPLPEGGFLSKNEIRRYIESQKIKVNDNLMKILKLKPVRSISGVSPVTVFTKPYFCSGKCIFCPTRKNAPKSYLLDEPGIQRAVSQNFDPYDQVITRLKALSANGHDTSKIEVIISGGTWDDYELSYRREFINNIFKALNEFNSQGRATGDISLNDLQDQNSTSKTRCVGMSIETRPDKVNYESIKQYRKFGITKVQLGIQSLNDEILEKNFRGHKVQDSHQAIELLRQNGFKIQIHWMCNLYGSTSEGDYEDFIKLFNDPRVMPDELKIYPCSIIPGTGLEELYKNAKFTPYSEKGLIRLLARCKVHIPKYCRVARLFRDIPSGNISAGVDKTNLRQLIHDYMGANSMECQCIRCREIRDEIVEDIEDLKYEEIEYKTSVSKEVFMSYSYHGKLVAFLRLSLLNNNENLIKSKALIRELHVYGVTVGIGKSKTGASQHIGLGSELIQKACKKACEAKVKQIAVISAVGTRKYYEKLGFNIEKDYGYGIRDLR
ncbi:tRNA uridine(34) 5-carboxymethylaminomethyl modification radical SAM/GNAT enzyme Elp3 [Candidatus Dojkabacteria bacterium]|nr:tRNA uridine(34) 5-carboxymethylaminomethyl modification radical SAM/GNAT enzyme Elp3 [Candidatus Dojkabacteria bacterium]